MFNMFRKSQEEVTPQVKQKHIPHYRRFVGAKPSLQSKWDTTYARINQELKSDYIALTLRARSLVKNNEVVASYINLMQRQVIGAKGFVLTATSYNEDGSADTLANKQIEDAWYDYSTSYKKYVSADGQMTDADFDKLILTTLLTDGEVFIRKIKDNKSPYGIRYAIIDSLDVDTLKNQLLSTDGTRIVMGIKIDSNGKPLSYFVRKTKNTDYYISGDNEQVDASQIIHIYRQQFAGQVRGFTPLASVMQCLNSLETYKRAEIDAAILNSVMMGVWIKQGTADNAYDDYDDEEIDENGNVATEIETNVFRFAPNGYNLQQIASNHPNSNISTFFKAMLKNAAGALGISYNKIASDASETNYSSLRQFNIEDQATIRQLQNFLIVNWKNVQYAQWLKYLLLSDITNLPYSKIDKFLVHDFRGQQAQYLDPAKEMQSIKMRLSLGLSSPIEEIQNLGKDPIDVLNEWAKWNTLLKQRGLKLADTMQLIADTVDNDINDENNNEGEVNENN